jgi:hypothetical protein
MAQRVYALRADYALFAEEEFDGLLDVLDKRLRAASLEVDGLTRNSRYVVDATGCPTDAVISAAFTEATCAIVEYWEETGDVRGADAASGAVSIGSVSLGGGRNTQALTGAEKITARIGGQAITILANAGLISSAVYYR